MDHKEDIVVQFAKYCSQCDGQCCKRGVFTVFGKEAEVLAREYGEFKTCDVFDQRGTAKDMYIGSKCIFNNGKGCKLPMNLRPTDCLSFPFYPKLTEINGELQIDSFVIQNECPFSKEIANDKQFLEAMQQLWEATAKELTAQEIIDWIGINGSWHDWYDNAIEVKCDRPFNLKLKDDKPKSNVKKLFTFLGFIGLLKSILVFAMAVLPSIANA